MAKHFELSPLSVHLPLGSFAIYGIIQEFKVILLYTVFVKFVKGNNANILNGYIDMQKVDCDAYKGRWCMLQTPAKVSSIAMYKAVDYLVHVCVYRELSLY